MEFSVGHRTRRSFCYGQQAIRVHHARAGANDFRQLHPVLAGLKLTDLVPHGLAAPLHPGAERYFREAGLLN